MHHWRDRPRSTRPHPGGRVDRPHYAHVLEPSRARHVSELALVGLSARAGYGRRLGYGFGFELEAGAGFPLGFAYNTRLYPAGVMLMLGDDTFLGLFNSDNAITIFA